jgi:hypothetical protein
VRASGNGKKRPNTKNAKKKSSGWRPVQKRGHWRERSARQSLRQAAEFREKCDQADVWKACPSARCQRVHGCAGRNPLQCWQDYQLKEQKAQIERRRPAETQTAVPRATNGLNAALPPMSSKEAAALIAASIAAAPPEPLWGDDV